MPCRHAWAPLLLRGMAPHAEGQQRKSGHWRHIHGWHKPCQVLPIEEDVALDRLGSWVDLEACPTVGVILCYLLIACSILFDVWFILFASFAFHLPASLWIHHLGPILGLCACGFKLLGKDFLYQRLSFHINDLPSQSCRSWRFWPRHPSLWQPHLCQFSQGSEFVQTSLCSIQCRLREWQHDWRILKATLCMWSVLFHIVSAFWAFCNPWSFFYFVLAWYQGDLSCDLSFGQRIMLEFQSFPPYRSCRL